MTARFRDPLGPAGSVAEPALQPASPIAAILGRIAVGQCVKVKGIADGSGALLAMEIEPCPGDDRLRVAGRVQAIDLGARTVRLLGRDLAIAPAARLTGPDGGAIEPAAIEPGTRVKLEAVRGDDSQWWVSAVRVTRQRDFVIEKLRGTIETVDGERALLVVAGFTVRIDPGTMLGETR